MNVAGSHIGEMVGDWHLVDIEADEARLPQHRVDLTIRRTGDGLTGAVLSRIDGSDAQAVTVEFDGATLRLQMKDPKRPNETGGPWLVLGRANDRFEGQWHDKVDEPTGPRLKLVRARR